MLIQIDREFKDLIPPLQKEERDQLEANIKAEGCRDPLTVWEGTLMDGHNRHEICTRLNIPFNTVEISFPDRSHAIEWVIKNQFGRRNLSAYDRIVLLGRLEKVLKDRGRDIKVESGKKTGRGNKLEKVPQKSAEPFETRKELAKLADVSHDTVNKVQKIEKAAKEGKVAPEVIQKIRTGDTSINRVVRDLKESAAKERIEEIKAEAVKKLVSVDEIVLGDFREKADEIPDNSVDLIFTDPPYDRAAIKLFDGLGEFAAKKLRPGGSLVFYLGQIQLPSALEILSKHLRYWWCCSCYHSGPTLLRMNEYGIVNGWKPILWFVKESRVDKETFINDVATGTKEKSHHEWQQAEAEALYFIEKLTNPGDFVVDPFCGGGTTPSVCEKHGRKWKAFEIDPANYARSCERIISQRL